MAEPIFTSGIVAVSAHELDTLRLHDTDPAMLVRSFGMTHTGMVRATNEDHFLIVVLLKALHVQQSSIQQVNIRHSKDRSHLFVVADGMGGHEAGEQASTLAIDSVETFILGTFKWFAQLKGPEEDQVLADFQRATGHANDRIFAEAAAHPRLRGMGTTLTLAYCLNDTLFIAHAGDSRCYLCRKGSLYRLTNDHTLVEEMVRRGTLTPEEAAKHKLRHVITNAVGGHSSELNVEVHKLLLESGDRVLLCSDGLTDMVAEPEINDILSTKADPESACECLVLSANNAGGRDNITAIVAHFSAAD